MRYVIYGTNKLNIVKSQELANKIYSKCSSVQIWTFLKHVYFLWIENSSDFQE